MPHLTLENLPDLPLKAHAVPLPELGEGMEAYVAELSADEQHERAAVVWRDHKAGAGLDDDAEMPNSWAVAACWCHPDRTFVAADADDIAAAAARLGAYGSRVVNRLAEKIAEINGVGDAEKNSQPNSGANGTPS